MTTARNVGRTIGVLAAAQLSGGGLVTMALLDPVLRPPGYLVNAAANSFQIGLSVVLGLITGVLSIAIAITAWPVFRECSRAMALWFLSLAIVAVTLAVVENSAVMSLLSLSQAYAKASAADASMFEALRVVVAASRNWAHYTHLLVGGGTFLVFYAILYRFALIPRPLAALGLVASPLQMIAVAMPLFGYSVVKAMLAPMGLVHVGLTLWLMVKGFEERPASVTIDERPARTASVDA